jgi:DNA-binding Lrp family transcriptional regulator
LRNLVESKTIKIAGYPLSSPNEVRAALGIRTEPAKLKTVTETLAASRSVMWLRNATGRYDIFAMTVFKSNEELSNFLVRDVERLDGVEYHEMSLVVETNSFYEARFNEYWATRERDA